MPKGKQAAKLEKEITGAVMALESLLSASKFKGRGTVIADLLYRAEMPSIIDGYPKGGESDKTSGGATNDPTLNAVMNRELDVCIRCDGGKVKLKNESIVTCRVCDGSGRRWADPIADAVDQIMQDLQTVLKMVRLIDTKKNMILRSSKTLGRESSLQGSCDVCSAVVSGVGADRLRRGLDSKCYLSWNSYKTKHPNPDPGLQYLQFKQWRRNNLTKASTADS